MKHLTFAAVLALALNLIACHEPDARRDADFHSIDAAGWAYGQTFEFSPAVTDSCGYTNVAVAVRHNNDYGYSNLWLEITSPLPDTDSLRIDTIDLQMADVYGHWYGRGAAMSYIVVDTLPGEYYFEVDKPLKLRHIMRVDTVPNLTQVGLIFPSLNDRQ